MIILEDTRQQTARHKIKQKWFEENGITVMRTKLFVGDYTLPTNQSLCIDTKKDLLEVAGNICGKQHERFRNELIRANEAGIKLIILIEDDVYDWNSIKYWKNKNTKVKGEVLEKAMKTMEEKYGVKFEFCKKSESASIIYQLLLNA